MGSQLKRHLLSIVFGLALVGCEAGTLANLTAGLNSNGSSSADNTPPNFSGLSTAVANNSGQPVLTWSGATSQFTSAVKMSYTVYRSSNQFTVFSLPYATLTGVTSYTDTNVTLGLTYWYAVRASNSNGVSDSNSIIKSVQTISPVTFAGLTTARAISDTRVELDYAAATGGSGSVYYNFYQNSNFSASIGSSSTTQFIAQNLSPGTSYTFVARAVDSVAGETPSSVSKQVTTLQCCYPVFNGIQSLTDSPGIAGQTQLTATWAPATAPSGRTIASYNVYTSIVSGGEDFTSPPQYQSLLTTFNLTGLTSGTQYYVVVRAVDSAGNEELNSLEMTANTSSVQPISFSGLASASRGAGSAGFNTVMLTWPSGTGTFDEYQVFMSTTPGGENYGSPIKTLGSSATSTTLTAADGISGNHNYYFVVRAVNSGTGVNDGNTHEKNTTTTPSSPAFLGITSAALPAGVAALNTVTVGWSAAAGVFNGYRVFARWPARAAPQNAYDFSLNGGSTDFANAYSTVGSSFTSQSLTPLTQNEQVCFAVRAVWVDGTNFLQDTQDTQDILHITEKCATPQLSPPSFGGITTLTVAPAPNSTSSVIASWNQASGVFDSYEIFAGASSASVINIANNAGAACDTGINPCRITQQSTTDGVTPLTTSTLTGLPPGTNIYVIVRALYSVSGTTDGNTSYLYTPTAALNAHLAWTQNPTGTTPGNPMPVQPIVCLYDATNKLITSITSTVTLSITAGAANASLASGPNKSYATLANGCATFSGTKLIDTNMASPAPVTITASAPGVSASAGVTVQNAIGSCTATYFYPAVLTSNGGCTLTQYGITVSHAAPISMTWYDAVVPAEYDNDPGVGPDISPTTGYCHDLIESGYSDWRLPSIAEWNQIETQLPGGYICDLNFGLIDGGTFPGCFSPVSAAWSSTSYTPNGGGSAWVNNQTVVGDSKTAKYAVFCVRNVP